MKNIKVAELFAGVGGFRLGLEKASKDIKVVWSNQWEPATKIQHASDIYIKRFGSCGHSNEDIAKVSTKDIPEHDLLVGGFPCQDYSVAKTLSHSTGLQGKKGVLWWEIYRILKEKGEKRPNYILLENVDRLLKSPAKQRGRDFAIMLSTLSSLGYIVEWRVINAADYGMPQRRRRVFIMGYKKDSPIGKNYHEDAKDWMLKEGVLNKAFPVYKKEPSAFNELELKGSIKNLSDSFNATGSLSPFKNAGVVLDKKVITVDLKPKFLGETTYLKDILVDHEQVGKEYYISRAKLAEWQYLKGAKKEERSSKDGFKYIYSEGSMVFPDALDKPSRTIVTGEGGPSPSRFKHVVKTNNGKLRRLTPIELERLCMFPDNHTEGAPDTKRAFLMGNALVVGVIERIGKELSKKHKKYA